MILKKIQTPLLYIIFSVAGILQFPSCIFFTEPEPFENKDIHPAEIKYKTATFENYSQDQQVTGVIDLQFIPDFDLNLVKSISAFVDSTEAGRLSLGYIKQNSPQLGYQINIDTKRWADGKHNIALYTYKIPGFSDSLGIMNLLTTTLYVYQTSLVFNNTPPTAPENVVVILQNKDAHISWNPTNLNNFNSYLIRRDGNVIAKIYNQNTSTYIDTTLPDFYSGYYEVGASNGAETQYSEKSNFIKGESLGLSIIDAIGGLNDQVVFVQSNNNLTSVSTQNKTIITQVNNGHIGLWAKSTNNDTLYCWDFQQNFYTYTVNTLNLVRTQRINLINNITRISQIGRIVSGPGNQVYMTISVHKLDQGIVTHGLYTFDKDETVFNLTNALPLAIPDYINYFTVSPDGVNLVLLNDERIKKYSVNNDSLIFNLQSTPTDFIGEPQSDWNNSRLFLTHYKTLDEGVAEAWDMNTLNLIRTYELPEPKTYPIYTRALFANSVHLYIAYDPNSHLLAEYDINSGQLLRTWKFSSQIISLFGSENGRYLFACTSSEQWIVDLGVAQ